MPSIIVFLLAVAAGYISLSQEILWIRILSYATGGATEVFGHVLGFMLLGIAGGALFGRRICQVNTLNLMLYCGTVFVVIGVLYFFSVPLIAEFREQNIGKTWAPSADRALFTAYLLIIVISFFQGSLFPVLCQLKAKGNKAIGMTVSWIYFGNILGATCGPLLTGFVLLNQYSLQKNILIISILSVFFGALAWLVEPSSNKIKIAGWSGIAAAMLLFIYLPNLIFDRLLEKLQGWPVQRYSTTIQNRSGIIAIINDTRGDIVYGGGIYDGRFNTDPKNDANGIRRAYFVSALHRSPSDVLEIGLSSGSWLKVLNSFAKIKNLMVVEINRGYFEAIKNNPITASTLMSPKVTFAIDDGRRWLRRNTNRKFDLIVMNTTYHWRSQVTNLLSIEFFRSLKSHLKPGGVIYFNTTHSEDSKVTVARVFTHVLQHSNFVAASDSEFTLSRQERYDSLLDFYNGAVQIFTRDYQSREVMESLVNSRYKDIGEALRTSMKSRASITEDNMLVEYKNTSLKPVGIGKWLINKPLVLYEPSKTWWNIVELFK